MSPLFYLFAYLLGTIPFGLFVARLVQGIDIREHGSKNIGATNVFRVVGKKWGLLVFCLDALKGYAAVALPFRATQAEHSLGIALVLGIAVILGHTFPVWLKFKGGKGVATSLGVFLAASPVPAWLSFGLWILVFLITHIISIASLCAAMSFPLACFFVYRHHPELAYLLPVSLLLCFFIIFTHRANIQRLARGEEKRLF